MSAMLRCLACGKPFVAKNTMAKWCPVCKVVRRRQYQQEYESGKRRGNCIDCQKDIGARALRCRVCDNISRSERYTGEANPNWQEGRSHSHGYVYVRVKEGTPGKGKGAFYRGEHTLNWERANNKPLPRGWVVHHLNADKSDNRVANLAAMPRQYHHSHPREALRVYERRIRELEKELLDVQQARMDVT